MLYKACKDIFFSLKFLWQSWKFLKILRSSSQQELILKFLVEGNIMGFYHDTNI